MPQTIGIVTSLSWGANDPFRANFEAGYGAMPTYANASPLEAKGDYDSRGGRNRILYRGMDRLNKNAPQGATIVVSVGGLVAAHPVVQKATQPFIVLVGRIPEATDFLLRDNDNFCGGVELHMVSDNIKRRDWLVAWSQTLGGGNVIDPNQVYLLFNPNSRMGRSEANEWLSQAQGGDAIPAAMPGANDTNEFDRAFARVAAAAGAQRTGVVISSDPFFLSKQASLVGSANTAFQNAQIRTCYPFDLFRTNTAAPIQGSAIGYGPDLAAAYQTMGVKAKAIANELDLGHKAPFVGLDTAQLPPNPTQF